MLTSVAFVVCHDSVVEAPESMVDGFALIEAVGAAGGGGGGGGGGGTFFLQAPNNMMAPKANTRVIHFILSCFTFSSLLLRVMSARGFRQKTSELLCLQLP